MKKGILTTLVLGITFYLGFAFGEIENFKTPISMKRVTGIGGVFFKCKDPKQVSEWYQKHLGLPANEYGAMFEWYESPDSSSKAMTQWTPFSDKTKYFEPSTKEFMINYRVENLEALIVELKNEGVTILDEMETYDYGKFVHILDPEGNKVELWEPIG
jgi:predicted enzyme related to lactoylglutathione lyase